MVERPDTLFPAAANVSLRRRGKTILDGVSHSFAPTGTTVILGANGAGKSSLLRVLHMLVRPGEGRVVWPVEDSVARHWQSFVFQRPTMMRRNVADNLAYPLIVRGMGRVAAREAARPWAQRIGLGDAMARDATRLSGGEQQKLAMARALIIQPRLVYLDEPTAHLDGHSTREIEAMVQQAMADGVRVIMATHDLGQARRLADDVVFLHDGRLEEHALAGQFFEAPRSARAQAFLKGDIVS